MAKRNRPIDDNALDLLLREFLLDETNISLTEKTIDMNAALVFNANAAVALPAENEKVLLNDLEKLLATGKKRGGWWLPALLLLFFASAVLFWLLRPAEQSPVVSQGNNSSSPRSAAPLTTDTLKPDPRPRSTFSVASFQKTDSLRNDSVPVVDSALQKPETHQPGIAGKMHIPIDYDYDDYPVAAKDPVFTAKASPDNFKVAKGTFTIDTINTGDAMFHTNQSSAVANYYEGEPFKSGMGDYLYLNFGSYAMHDEGKTKLPWQVLDYADSNAITIGQRKSNGNDYGYLRLNQIPAEGVRLATEPFYFAKYEVTNAEYREFINWVRTSNGFGNKPVNKFTIDTVEVTDPKDNSGEQFTQKGKRYRIVRKSERLEDYNTVYKYIFFNPSQELVAEMNGNTVCVFPDTLSWVNDFTFSFNEPMSNMYFWHPAYDNYPVVGISWFQAMAFLDWKTYMHQKQLDNENVPYVIEYTLPSDIEWDLASEAIPLTGSKVAFEYPAECCDDWLTNLGIQYSNDDPYDRPDYLKNLFTKDQYFRGDYIRDGFFHTGPAKLPKGSGGHVGPLNICWMDGNVSEWMIESYAANWKPFFQKHLLAMDVDKRESTQLAKQIELFYDKGNAANGKLVRGANWYDERFGSKPGSPVNDAGIAVKRYVDPHAQHSTIGFRYVIHVKYKDEASHMQP